MPHQRAIAATSLVLTVVLSACTTGRLPVEPADTLLLPPVRPLTVTILDVGQGDGLFLENGGTTVIVDAGESPSRMAAFIAEAGLSGDTIDFMIVTHAHFDHYGGLREFFKTSHGITIRRFYENKDAGAAQTLAELRDSVIARANRGVLQYLDTDDPCGDGRSICTQVLAGGAKLHFLRPMPTGGVNDRSVAVKVVGPDSASFTMWISGDAEHAAQQFFENAYATNPGMKVHVLKGNHHGSCNGVRRRFLELTMPEWTTFGVSSTNSFGHVHEQTKTLHRALNRPWLRTDENGRIIIRTTGNPGDGYTIVRERGSVSLDGQRDAVSAQSACAGL